MRIYEELFIVRPDATDEEVDPLIEQLKGKGMAVTKPNLKPFKDAMGPADAEIAKYAGAANVATFKKYVEEAQK